MVAVGPVIRLRADPATVATVRASAAGAIDRRNMFPSPADA